MSATARTSTVKCHYDGNHKDGAVQCGVSHKRTNTLVSQFFQKGFRRWRSPLFGVNQKNVHSCLPLSKITGFKILTVRVRLIQKSNKERQYFRTFLSGRPKRNSRSKRPGLLRAGSMESSLFVAPITTTSPRASNPSIRARRVDTMELQTHNKKDFNDLFHFPFGLCFQRIVSPF